MRPPKRFKEQYQAVVEEVIEKAAEEELSRLYTSFTGICTSFCILIASRLKEQAFYFDTGGHRFVITRSGLPVNSSARKVYRL